VYTISVTIGRNSAELARDIKAPFTSALQKADSVASLLANVEEMRNVPLSLEKNTLQTTITIPAEPVTKALYLVEQPIIFQRNDGRVCFRAPVYSPVPLPERFLSCGLR
jgi:hypothetical protein